MFAIPVSLFKVSIWDKLNGRHTPLRLCYYAPVLNYAEHEGVKWWPEKNAFICSRETLCLQKAFAGETHLIPESAPVSILCGLDGVLEISIHLYRLNKKKRKNEIKKDYSLHSLSVSPSTIRITAKTGFYMQEKFILFGREQYKRENIMFSGNVFWSNVPEWLTIVKHRNSTQCHFS